MKKIIITFILVFMMNSNSHAQNKEEIRIKEMISYELSHKYKLDESTFYKDKTIQRVILSLNNKTTPLDGIQSQHIIELPIKGVDYNEGETYNLRNVSDAILEGINDVYNLAGSDVISAEINKYCIEFVSVKEKRIVIVTLINSKDSKERLNEMNRQIGLFEPNN
jgi:hypothetical protein